MGLVNVPRGAQEELLYYGARAVVAAPVLAWASLANGQTFVTITPAGATDSRTINAALAASTDRPTFCAALALELNTAGTTAYTWAVNTSSPVDGIVGTAKSPGAPYNSAPTGTALVGGAGSVTTRGSDPIADPAYPNTNLALSKGQVIVGTDGNPVPSTVGTDNQLEVFASAQPSGRAPQSLVGLIEAVIQKSTITVAADTTTVDIPMTGMIRAFKLSCYFPTGLAAGQQIYLFPDGVQAGESLFTISTAGGGTAKTRAATYCFGIIGSTSGSTYCLIEGWKTPDGKWDYKSIGRTLASGTYYVSGADIGSLGTITTKLSLVCSTTDGIKAGAKIDVAWY